MPTQFDIDKSLTIIAGELMKLNENGIIRTKHLVGDLGEYYVCQYFRMQRCEIVNQKGYDAIDREGMHVQIKTRLKPENVNKIPFSSQAFDYCIFVELNEFFKPVVFRKASHEIILNNLEITRTRLSVGVFKRISEVIFFK